MLYEIGRPEETAAKAASGSSRREGEHGDGRYKEHIPGKAAELEKGFTDIGKRIMSGAGGKELESMARNLRASVKAAAAEFDRKGVEPHAGGDWQ